MKLASIILLTVFVTIEAVQDYISYSPLFQTSNPRTSSAENLVYLPPEPSTPIPFFPIKTYNKLPFPYLPLSEINEHAPFSTPFPYLISSSVHPPIIKKNDEEDYNNDNRRASPQFSSNKVNPSLRNRINVTEINSGNQKIEKSDTTFNPQQMRTHQPIDRIDMKLQNQFTMNKEPTTMISRPTARSMIISGEMHSDQFKPENYQNYMNVQLPKFHINPTTETAIPILRLSNEMDLDGSFSYEALGADQTHYVQHSRIENVGSDNQEQVVEGSYSYVGDNGQTYTVNYIADSNGFRASGDHLPVAPPIPEIIQRSIQYNLAKEAIMPPEAKYEEEESDPTRKEKLHNVFTHSTHNLFTGRTPESFSFGYPGYNTKNNLITSASTQAPMKTNTELIQEYMKDKPSATMSPQITFLASQGAHVPSFNTAEQTMSRHNSNDKPNMLHLINYEAPVKDNDQEGSKGLWRWQYGLNTELNHTPEKNTISRSSGDDDIVINFNDMTSDQYANMIRSQLTSNQKHADGNVKNELHEVKNKNPSIDANYNFVTINNEIEQKSSTVRAVPPTHYDSSYKNVDQMNNENNKKTSETVVPFQPEALNTSVQPKVTTQHEYVLPTQIVTQSHDYDNTLYEPKRIKYLNTNVTPISEINKLTHNNNYKSNYDLWFRPSNSENILVSTTQEPYIATSEAAPFRKINIDTAQNKNGFIPLSNIQADYPHGTATNQLTTETVIDIFKENVFLKNVINNYNKKNVNNSMLIKDENNNDYRRNSDIQTNEDNFPQFKSPSSYHDMNSIQRRPVDIANILNYISSRNQFESSKIRPKFKQSFNNFEERAELTPSQRYRYEDNSEYVPDHSVHNYQNRERQDGLRGIIKNYKTLQRNHNFNKEKETDNIKNVLINPQDHNLPPLGRAGPSTKTYLPPTFA